MERDFSFSLYLIISCQDYISLYEDNIEITSKKVETIKKEIITIKKENIIYMNVKEVHKSFKNKNIYLYKLKLKSKGYKDEITIKLHFNYDIISTKYSLTNFKKEKYNFFFLQNMK